MKYEEEEGHSPKWKLAVVLALIGILVTVGIVSASYVLTSNHITGSTSTAGVVSLTSNSTSIVSGDGVQLTATITSVPLGVSGWSCQLYNGTAPIGLPVVTTGTGTAIFTQTVNGAYDFYVVATHA